METEIVIKKKQVEKYIVRKPGNWWALITLDNDHGDIAIQSDWGTWAYVWPYPGRGDETLKQFLCRAGTGYIKNKFSYDQGGGENYWHKHETEKLIKKDLLRLRREHECDKEQAREIWEEVESAIENTDSWQHFVERMFDCEAAVKVYGHELWESLPHKMGYQPRLEAFMERCWPLFIAELKREIYGQACNDTAAQSPG